MTVNLQDQTSSYALLLVVQACRYLGVQVFAFVLV